MRKSRANLIRGAAITLLLLASAFARAQAAGDVNDDGVVSLVDSKLVEDHLVGRTALSGSALARADANADGMVDVADLVFILAHLSPPQTPTPSPSPSPTPGAQEITFTLPGAVPLTVVKISQGSFQMGSVDSGWSFSYEAPVHTVSINYDYYMGKFEVTQRQWLAVMASWPGSTPSSSLGVGDDFPAYYVSWNDIQNFEASINALGLGGTFRLPSEAEWEYAARGGTQTRFHFGDSTCSSGSCADCDISQYAWWCGNNTGSPGQSGYGSKIVGGKLPNQYGLYDTAGNLWEWCQDWYHSTYTGAPTDGSSWESPVGLSRAFRGGDWGVNPFLCRPAVRNSVIPDNRFYYIGFRLAWTP